MASLMISATSIDVQIFFPNFALFNVYFTLKNKSGHLHILQDVPEVLAL